MSQMPAAPVVSSQDYVVLQNVVASVAPERAAADQPQASLAMINAAISERQSFVAVLEKVLTAQKAHLKVLQEFETKVVAQSSPWDQAAVDAIVSKFSHYSANRLMLQLSTLKTNQPLFSQKKDWVQAASTLIGILRAQKGERGQYCDSVLQTEIISQVEDMLLFMPENIDPIICASQLRQFVEIIPKLSSYIALAEVPFHANGLKQILLGEVTTKSPEGFQEPKEVTQIRVLMLLRHKRFQEANRLCEYFELLSTRLILLLLQHKHSAAEQLVFQTVEFVEETATQSTTEAQASSTTDVIEIDSTVDTPHSPPSLPKAKAGKKAPVRRKGRTKQKVTKRSTTVAPMNPAVEASVEMGQKLSRFIASLPVELVQHCLNQLFPSTQTATTQPTRKYNPPAWLVALLICRLFHPTGLAAMRKQIELFKGFCSLPSALGAKIGCNLSQTIEEIIKQAKIAAKSNKQGANNNVPKIQPLTSSEMSGCTCNFEHHHHKLGERIDPDDYCYLCGAHFVDCLCAYGEKDDVYCPGKKGCLFDYHLDDELSKTYKLCDCDEGVQNCEKHRNIPHTARSHNSPQIAAIRRYLRGECSTQESTAQSNNSPCDAVDAFFLSELLAKRQNGPVLLFMVAHLFASAPACENETVALFRDASTWGSLAANMLLLRLKTCELRQQLQLQQLSHYRYSGNTNCALDIVKSVANFHCHSEGGGAQKTTAHAGKNETTVVSDNNNDNSNGKSNDKSSNDDDDNDEPIVVGFTAPPGELVCLDSSNKVESIQLDDEFAKNALELVLDALKTHVQATHKFDLANALATALEPHKKCSLCRQYLIRFFIAALAQTSEDYSWEQILKNAAEIPGFGLAVYDELRDKIPSRRPRLQIAKMIASEQPVAAWEMMCSFLNDMFFSFDSDKLQTCLEVAAECGKVSEFAEKVKPRRNALNSFSLLQMLKKLKLPADKENLIILTKALRKPDSSNEIVDDFLLEGLPTCPDLLPILMEFAAAGTMQKAPLQKLRANLEESDAPKEQQLGVVLAVLKHDSSPHALRYATDLALSLGTEAAVNQTVDAIRQAVNHAQATKIASAFKFACTRSTFDNWDEASRYSAMLQQIPPQLQAVVDSSTATTENVTTPHTLMQIASSFSEYRQAAFKLVKHARLGLTNWEMCKTDLVGIIEGNPMPCTTKHTLWRTHCSKCWAQQIEQLCLAHALAHLGAAHTTIAETVGLIAATFMRPEIAKPPLQEAIMHLASHFTSSALVLTTHHFDGFQQTACDIQKFVSNPPCEEHAVVEDDKLANWLAKHSGKTIKAMQSAVKKHILTKDVLVTMTAEELSQTLELLAPTQSIKAFVNLRTLMLAIAQNFGSSATAKYGDYRADTELHSNPQLKDAIGSQAVAKLQPVLSSPQLVRSLSDDELTWIASQVDLSHDENLLEILRALRNTLTKCPSIEPFAVLPPKNQAPCTFVVVGATGSGKSTLLNALLGETVILPTNCMRACTATVIELEYNCRAAAGAVYTATVEFWSPENWKKELQALCSVLADTIKRRKQQRTQTARDAQKTEEIESQAHEALGKLKSVYGAVEVDNHMDNLLDHLRQAQPIGVTMLGKSVSLRAPTALELSDQLAKYVDSANDESSGAYWPLVRRVCVRGPWNLLAGGLRVVDAPGLHDDNSTRAHMVRDYLKQADGVILVSNIRRAINDKTTKELLTPALRTFLCEHGFMGQLIHVVTQTDQLVRSEVLENLSLPEDTDLLGCTLARNNFTRNKLSRDFYAGVPLQLLPINQEELSLDSDEITGTSSLKADDTLRFEYPVFAVSSIEFQKALGLRPEEGSFSVFSDIFQTEIPALRGLLNRVAQEFGGWDATKKIGEILLDNSPSTVQGTKHARDPSPEKPSKRANKTTKAPAKPRAKAAAKATPRATRGRKRNAAATPPASPPGSPTATTATTPVPTAPTTTQTTTTPLPAGTTVVSTASVTTGGSAANAKPAPKRRRMTYYVVPRGMYDDDDDDDGF